MTVLTVSHLIIVLAEQLIVPNKCIINVHKKVSKKCIHNKKSSKSVHKQCQQKVSIKSIHKKCQLNSSTKCVHKNCPLKCPQKSVPKSVGYWGRGGGAMGGPGMILRSPGKKLHPMYIKSPKSHSLPKR